MNLDPQVFFDRFHGGLPLRSMSALANKGADLARELFPPRLMEKLWQLWLENQKSPKTLWLQTDESWIPWEFLQLQGKSQGRWGSGVFLCEAFRLCRWRPGISPTAHLPLERVGLVRPEASDLMEGMTEVGTLGDLFGQRLVDVVPFQEEVLARMAEGTFDGWHFIGHGFAEAEDFHRWGIELEDKDLLPEDLNGEPQNLGNAQPLVFFNACDTGRGGLSLVGMDGWATRFLELGAGAFLGATFAVADDEARLFSETFYREFLGGCPMGEAVFRARRRLREETEGLSWLAYAVFAHPAARCRPPCSTIDTPPQAFPVPREESSAKDLRFRARRRRRPALARTGLILGLVGLLSSLGLFVRRPTSFVLDVSADRVEFRLGGETAKAVSSVPFQELVVTGFGLLEMPAWLKVTPATSGSKGVSDFVVTAQDRRAQARFEPLGAESNFWGQMDRIWVQPGTRLLFSTHAAASSKMFDLAMAVTPSQPVYLVLEEPFRFTVAEAEVRSREDDGQVAASILEGRLSSEPPLATLYASGEEMYLNSSLPLALCSSSNLAQDLLVERVEFLAQDLQGVLRSSILGGELQLPERAEIVRLRLGELLAVESEAPLELSTLGCDPVSGRLRLRLAGVADRLSTAWGESRRDLRSRLLQQVCLDCDVERVQTLFLGLLVFLAIGWWFQIRGRSRDAAL